ncbi:ATP-dependent DNA helicase Q4 [Drosophila nasuta]|uniref:ATP-dependent DNA helicase Q4 n=1 Tax=Drosophila nasuta TaxID=42062 RepID=UPI00295EB272|nr:ATP-dependent DNA helicase Q4 [Drosophila nasuta]
MDESIFKDKYQKYKLRVKIWEKDFKKKHGRVPSKYDIREASQEIRDSYKMYYKLKTSFLEETLNDVLSEDGFDVLEMTQSEDLGVSTLDDGPQLPINISALVQQSNSESFSNIQELPTPQALSNLANLDENHVIRKFEAAEELAQNQTAWGENVSKKQPPPVEQQNTSLEESAKSKTPSIKPSITSKLFQSSRSFAKRNPRKPMSRSSLNMSASSVLKGDNDASMMEQLPDLETILIRKAQDFKAAEAIAGNALLAADPKASKEAIKTHVDERWLQRNTAQNSLEPQMGQMEPEPNNNATPAGKKHNFGLSNIDVSKLKPIVMKLEEPPQEQPAVVQPAPVLQAAAPPTATAPVVEDSDSDSVVEESEEEAEQPEYRQIAKRRKIMTTNDSPSALTEVKLATEPAQSIDPPQIEMEQKLEAGEEEKEEGKDFSADEERDATYEPEQTKKAKRKQATAKRQKPKAEKKPAAKSKTEKQPKAEMQPKAEKQPKQTKPRAVKGKAKAAAIEATEEGEPEEQPLNPEDLKYVLALESGDITSVPRIQAEDLEQADVVAQRYISNFAAGTGAEARPSATIDEKRAMARKKLEEKIASGKLNENFVTINIQKKKFARGKKSINFSKYKKQQWRHKKRVAALTGPDMDMGGCDGGVLTCFNCGGVGHFAQQCKVKGDALLPLSAQLEEDPSPFPTLEEAEQMATQGALAAHSRNIERLPQAANAAIYQDADSSSSSSDEEEENAAVEMDVDEASGTPDEPHMSSDDSDMDFEALDAAVASSQTAKQVSPIKSYVGHKIPEEFLKQAGLDASSTSGQARSGHGGVKPLYDLNADGSVQELTAEVTEALHLFGHKDFRKGQDRAVMRILSGLSTLVTLSTGSGKSLCYQLPAYLYSRRMGAITLVISPLVSLMEDQVTGVPHFLRAHCLHTNQTPQQRMKIQQLIANGEIDILLVSPEAVVSGERATGFGAILRTLPPIAFACIDEAHCVSQWSHNFRPSYLMICKVLKKNLGVRTVLGLTATATLPTRISIINHLGITDGERGIISDIPLPDNLVLSVSKDENRDAALLQLLNSERFESCQSIIIYCTRRDECERIAGFIRTCMQDRKSKAEPEQTKKKRKRVNWQAEPYHAGMPASRRRTVQNAFMANELRIVVATIAFGMGINKPDIRAVIHYNMPRNFESYVQEIGRAGRDGLTSHCHLFLDAKGNDQSELRRHVYANSIDRHVIRKLLQRIFVPCCCDKQRAGGSSSNSAAAVEEATVSELKDAADFSDTSGARVHVCPGHEIGFSVEQTVEALDIPAENISTLLCYMELEPRWCMNVLSSAYIMAKVISYGGPKYLKHAAKECPPLAMAIALQIKNKTFKEDANIIEFSVIDIAAGIGWNSGVVKYQLKNLEWMQINGYPKRSPITVSFFDLGFRIKAPGDFSEAEIDNALDTLYSRSVKQERTQLIQLQYVAHGLSAVAYNMCVHCCSADFPQDRSTQLKGIVRNYFRNDYPQDLELEIEPSNVPDDHIISDVHALINMYPDNTFSGRNIARIFHGITSPNYPAVMWGRCSYWRAHTKVDFNRILKLANLEIVKRRT